MRSTPISNVAGRLMYMGGNGFFWRVAFHPDMPGMMEMRRGEDGLRTWDHGVGEDHLSFNGEAGGHWARLGRPPQSAGRQRVRVAGL